MSWGYLNHGRRGIEGLSFSTFLFLITILRTVSSAVVIYGGRYSPAMFSSIAIPIIGYYLLDDKYTRNFAISALLFLFITATVTAVFELSVPDKNSVIFRYGFVAGVLQMSFIVLAFSDLFSKAKKSLVREYREQTIQLNEAVNEKNKPVILIEFVQILLSWSLCVQVLNLLN